MISNRNSPTRALKLVISALQLRTSSGDVRRLSKAGQRVSESRSARSSRDETGETGGVFCQESGAHSVKEFKKLYGLLRMGSRRKESIDLSSSEEKGSITSRNLIIHVQSRDLDHNKVQILFPFNGSSE
ncbi:hypothetical protein OIU74_016199 [Salix koriyanagi]|uniref:Uncharacterized protein n=1 Tax=Salix koriyanagi TaxID=2511006 RepID=A0A9Q0PFT4_9ROSI|nr:hypothetical protein OIU74_016199 [Salix koriyanagi]